MLSFVGKKNFFPLLRSGAYVALQPSCMHSPTTLELLLWVFQHPPHPHWHPSTPTYPTPRGPRDLGTSPMLESLQASRSSSHLLMLTHGSQFKWYLLWGVWPNALRKVHLCLIPVIALCWSNLLTLALNRLKSRTLASLNSLSPPHFLVFFFLIKLFYLFY